MLNPWVNPEDPIDTIKAGAKGKITNFPYAVFEGREVKIDSSQIRCIEDYDDMKHEHEAPAKFTMGEPKQYVSEVQKPTVQEIKASKKVKSGYDIDTIDDEDNILAYRPDGIYEIRCPHCGSKSVEVEKNATGWCPDCGAEINDKGYIENPPTKPNTFRRFDFAKKVKATSIENSIMPRRQREENIERLMQRVRHTGMPGTDHHDVVFGGNDRPQGSAKHAMPFSPMYVAEKCIQALAARMYVTAQQALEGALTSDDAYWASDEQQDEVARILRAWGFNVRVPDPKEKTTKVEI